MPNEENQVLTAKEACGYLKVSRPTFLKLVHTNRIKARKVGRGWRLLRSEIQAYLTGGGRQF